MNEYEIMVKDMETAIGKALGITYEGERLPFSLHTRNCLAKDLVNAGYRKVADDEIVVKKIKEPFVFYDNREEIEKRMQEYEEEVAQAKQEEVREILTTIYNNLKYATVKQTGTLISIKTLATELGIELE